MSFNKICAVIVVLLSFVFVGCASKSKVFAFYCQERHIEIYVDDQYLGRDQVQVVVPGGQEYITVSCRDKGVEVYSKRIYVKDRKDQMFELQIPKNYKYNSNSY